MSAPSHLIQTKKKQDKQKHQCTLAHAKRLSVEQSTKIYQSVCEKQLYKKRTNAHTHAHIAFCSLFVIGIPVRFGRGKKRM